VQPKIFLTLASAVTGKFPVPISQTTGLVQKPVWVLGRKEKIFFAPGMEPRFVGPTTFSPIFIWTELFRLRCRNG